MAKISHYEVYTDTGSGWRLISRFGAEERATAFSIAKDKEKDRIPVKVIRETFDSADGSYVESVEYIRGLKAQRPSYKAQREAKRTINKTLTAKINVKKAFHSFFILVAIIALSAIMVNIFGSLLRPMLELFLPQHIVKTVFFIGLFVVFILIALPLVLHKVPWHDLSTVSINKEHVTEEVFVLKASDIVSRYSVNERFADDATPMFPEASDKDKKHIISLVAQILSSLSGYKMTDFNKFGIKLIIYGAVLQFCHYKRLQASKLNSLLLEAITILDGKETDLVNFYQAKRSFKDNKTAVYLTGLGAFAMDNYLARIPADKSMVRQGLEKWQNTNTIKEEEVLNVLANTEITVPNIVSIKHSIKLFDNSSTHLEKKEAEQISSVKNIINSLAEKFGGKPEENTNILTSFLFKDLVVGIAFAKQMLDDINTYIDELDDENIIFNIKINLIKKQTNNENLLYIQDLFDYTNDDEILTTLNIVNEAKQETNLSFESIGKKLLEKTSKNVELFKVI